MPSWLISNAESPSNNLPSNITLLLSGIIFRSNNWEALICLPHFPYNRMICILSNAEVHIRKRLKTATNINPKVRYQPFPIEGQIIVTIKSSKPWGENENHWCSRLSLILEKMFSKGLIKPAPNTGPINVLTPPRLVIKSWKPALNCASADPPGKWWVKLEQAKRARPRRWGD